MTNLIIVESPAKAKTIKKHLGKNYEIVASMGHLRDLPKSTLGVDIENNFTPKYINIKGKGPLIKDLKKIAAKSKNVFLATDPDREGEAISWHLAHILGLNNEDSIRITFNEITKSGIKNGMANPRKINMNLVDAQQARRVLDRLVGYKLSPFLWKRVGSGLSAGRVQSVAVMLIVDREEEIKKFKPEEFWTIEASLTGANNKQNFIATLFNKNDSKIEIKNEEQATEILKELETEKFVVKDITTKSKTRSPLPPFSTSTLQQEASRKLNFTAAKTMQIAQQLYEGITVKKHGTVGLITYMRTDSLRISEEAITKTRNFIENAFSAKYVPEKPRTFKTKSSSQDGHEAIRPTMPELTPNEIESSLSKDQLKLYKLIWERFIACQAANEILETTTIKIAANNYLFKISSSIVQFDGFTRIYSYDITKEKSTLPQLKQGEELTLQELNKLQHFTQPPARFSEATLTKALEELGIGRPSTYVPTLSTIQSRGYVTREKKQLKPTPLGEATTKIMKENFNNIVNVSFTAKIEEEFDDVSEGNLNWKDSIKNFYDSFKTTLEKAEQNTANYKIPLEETDETCDKCGKPMVIKRSRFGKFIACSGYPECKNTKKIVVSTNGKCPKCSGTIIRKKSGKGKIFYGCEKYPECDFICWDEPTSETCSTCGRTLFQPKKANSKAYCYVCSPKK